MQFVDGRVVWFLIYTSCFQTEVKYDEIYQIWKKLGSLCRGSAYESFNDSDPYLEATGSAKMQVSFDDLSSQVHVPDTWPLFLGDVSLPETDESPFIVIWCNLGLICEAIFVSFGEG